jgi:hypothetical protein
MPRPPSISPARLAVCDVIADAFAGVQLDDGIGLEEARGLDDYADVRALARFRSADERDRWDNIPVEKLHRYNDTLGFFDAKGMRFHLPAFMIAHLRGQISPGPVFHLSQLVDGFTAKFVALSPDQRQAVRSYLLVLRDDPIFAWDRPHIISALASYWTEDHSG